MDVSGSILASQFLEHLNMESEMTVHTIKHVFDPAKHKDPIVFSNDGPRVVRTNFWDHPVGKLGLCYLSGNAGHWRLLLPSRLSEAVQEFQNVSRALIEPSFQIAGHIDIVALDGSDVPYFVAIDRSMADRAITKKRCRLLVYTEQGLINNIPVKVRA